MRTELERDHDAAHKVPVSCTSIHSTLLGWGAATSRLLNKQQYRDVEQIATSVADSVLRCFSTNAWMTNEEQAMAVSADLPPQQGLVPPWFAQASSGNCRSRTTMAHTPEASPVRNNFWIKGLLLNPRLLYLEGKGVVLEII
ncbi:hypothetical protein VPH35_058483 [Triticum aestivum]